MPCQHRPVDVERVEQRYDVSREVFDAVARERLVRVAVPPLGNGDGVDPRW